MGSFVVIVLGVSQYFSLFVNRCLIECRDEYKYNVEAVELLIRNHLVNMQQYDLHLAQVYISHVHCGVIYCFTVFIFWFRVNT